MNEHNYLTQEEKACLASAIALWPKSIDLLRVTSHVAISGLHIVHRYVNPCTAFGDSLTAA